MLARALFPCDVTRRARRRRLQEPIPSTKPRERHIHARLAPIGREQHASLADIDCQRLLKRANGCVDAAARIQSSIAGRIKLRNTLPPLASNELLCGGVSAIAYLFFEDTRQISRYRASSIFCSPLNPIRRRTTLFG